MEYKTADSSLLIIHENSTHIYLFGDFISFSTAASPALRVGEVYWSSSQQLRVQRQGYIPDKSPVYHRGLCWGSTLYQNAEVCICFSFFCRYRSLWILQLGGLILNQSAIPRSECRVVSVLIRCQECTPERTPGYRLLLHMRSSDFIVFGRLGQTKRQACLSTWTFKMSINSGTEVYSIWTAAATRLQYGDIWEQ